MIHDITLPVGPSLACWPGDTPCAFRLTARRAAGEPVNVGAVTMSVHTGTHVDAPFHFTDDGTGADALDLERLVGPAVLLDVAGRSPIHIQDLEAAPLERAPRLLLRTAAWPDRTRFPAEIPLLAPGVPAYLGRRGVVLVGLDVPSVDALDSRDLPIHHALAARGIVILESLLLDGVPAGEYELIALPLKLVGADGAPARAILRSPA